MHLISKCKNIVHSFPSCCSGLASCGTDGGHLRSSTLCGYLCTYWITI